MATIARVTEAIGGRLDRLDANGVIVNHVPTFRTSHVPQGTVKDPGLGRDGPRYAIEDMTELRLLVVTRQATAP